MNHSELNVKMNLHGICFLRNSQFYQINMWFFGLIYSCCLQINRCVDFVMTKIDTINIESLKTDKSHNLKIATNVVFFPVVSRFVIHYQ